MKGEAVTDVYGKSVRGELDKLRPDQQKNVDQILRSWNMGWWPTHGDVMRAIKKVRNNNP